MRGFGGGGFADGGGGGGVAGLELMGFEDFVVGAGADFDVDAVGVLGGKELCEGFFAVLIVASGRDILVASGVIVSDIFVVVELEIVTVSGAVVVEGWGSGLLDFDSTSFPFSFFSFSTSARMGDALICGVPCRA